MPSSARRRAPAASAVAGRRSSLTAPTSRPAPEQLRATRRQRPARPARVLVEVVDGTAAAARRRRGRGPARRWRGARRGERRERTAQQRQHVDERVRRERGAASRPPGASSSLVVDQQQPAAGEEALDPARPLRRRARRPTARGASRRPARRSSRPGVEQQPRDPAGQQAVHVGPVDQAGQRGQPALLRLGRRRRRRPAASETAACTSSTWPRSVGAPSSSRPVTACGQPDADPHHQRRADPRQRGDVGAPHVAVAQRADQRRQRRHQVQRRRRRAPPARRAPASTAGEASARSASRQARPVRVSSASVASRRPVSTARRGRRGGTVVPHAPASTRSTANSGCQRQPPGLAERALACRRWSAGRAPVDAEQPQPVQQRGCAPGRCGGAGRGRARSPCAYRLSRSRRCAARQVGLQRHRRRRRRGPSRAARPRPVVGHQPRRRVVAVAQHGAGRLGHLGQPGQRPAPQAGERLGEPDRLDDVGGGDGQVLARAARAPPRSASG